MFKFLKYRTPRSKLIDGKKYHRLTPRMLYSNIKYYSPVTDTVLVFKVPKITWKVKEKFSFTEYLEVTGWTHSEDEFDGPESHSPIVATPDFKKFKIGSVDEWFFDALRLRLKHLEFKKFSISGDHDGFLIFKEDHEAVRFRVYFSAAITDQ